MPQSTSPRSLESGVIAPREYKKNAKDDFVSLTTLSRPGITLDDQFRKFPRFDDVPLPRSDPFERVSMKIPTIRFARVEHKPRPSSEKLEVASVKDPADPPGGFDGFEDSFSSLQILPSELRARVHAR